MNEPLTVVLPHRIGRAEARRRIEDGFGQLTGQLPGSGVACRRRWEGDRLDFDVAALGQTVTGLVDVGDDTVRIEVRLPGVLGFVAAGVARRLRSAAGRLLLPKP